MPSQTQQQTIHSFVIKADFSFIKKP
jgi:hypothetical protein